MNLSHYEREWQRIKMELVRGTYFQNLEQGKAKAKARSEAKRKTKVDKVETPANV